MFPFRIFSTATALQRSLLGLATTLLPLNSVAA
jgi:hypothetical protein